MSRRGTAETSRSKREPSTTMCRTFTRALGIVTAIVATGTDARAERSANASAATVVRRSTMDHSLTTDDRASIRELGFGQMHAGAVVIRKISKHDGRQVERLRQLHAALDGFKPAGLCERIVAQGTGRALCTTTTEGPLGSLPVRLPMEARLESREGGATRLVLRNARSLEVKFLFSWMEIVRPSDLLVSFDLLPQPDGWLLYTRVGVLLSKHENTAEKLCTLLLKLDTWLAQDLAES